MESDKLLKTLTQVEELAEEILTDKQQLVDLDRRRQKTREAVRAVSKAKVNEKQWVCLGNMFLKLPQPKTRQLLDKDYNELDKEISENSKNLKVKVNKLRDMEQKERLKGFDLQPLSSEEMKAINQFL